MLHNTVPLCGGTVGRSVPMVQLGQLRSVERYYLRKMGKPLDRMQSQPMAF